MRTVKIGVALGSGGARGWAHIGVLRALKAMGIEPDVLCGTSIGAAVGAAYLTDQLDDLQGWAQGMGWLGMLGIIDITLRRGGLVASEKAFGRFRTDKSNILIENMRKPFAAVATDLGSGREVWLREGPMLPAIQASSAIPGLFPAVLRDDRWLVDGALVNPVPVSLCRALGADVVIGVNLNSEFSPFSRKTGRNGQGRKRTPHGKADIAQQATDTAGVARYSAAADMMVGLEPGLTPGSVSISNLMSEADELNSLRTGKAPRRVRPFSAWLGRKPGVSGSEPASKPEPGRPPAPNLLEVVAGSIDIMQDRITRARLAGEPPDVLIAPRLGHVGILDFDRAEEVITLGQEATEALRPVLELATRRHA